MQESTEVVIQGSRMGVRQDYRTLSNDLGKKGRRVRSNQVIENRSTSCRLSHERNPFRITSKEMDVLLDPFEGKLLVKKSGVGIASLSPKIGTSKPTECAQLCGN